LNLQKNWSVALPTQPIISVNGTAKEPYNFWRPPTGGQVLLPKFIGKMLIKKMYWRQKYKRQIK
jgi:hypothetical protein